MFGKYMTTEEVCKFLKISKWSLTKLVNEKKISQPKKIFNRNVFVKDDISEYLRGNVVMKEEK